MYSILTKCNQNQKVMLQPDFSLADQSMQCFFTESQSKLIAGFQWPHKGRKGREGGQSTLNFTLADVKGFSFWKKDWCGDCNELLSMKKIWPHQSMNIEAHKPWWRPFLTCIHDIYFVSNNLTNHFTSLPGHFGGRITG